MVALVKVEVIEVADNGKINLDRVDKPDVKSEGSSNHRHGDDNGHNGRKPRRRHN